MSEAEHYAASERHRRVQHCEGVAGRLRRLANHLAHSFRRNGDAGQLNYQIALLNEAADIVSDVRGFIQRRDPLA